MHSNWPSLRAYPIPVLFFIMLFFVRSKSQESALVLLCIPLSLSFCSLVYYVLSLLKVPAEYREYRKKIWRSLLLSAMPIVSLLFILLLACIGRLDSLPILGF